MWTVSIWCILLHQSLLFSPLAISFPFPLTIKAQSDQGLSYQSHTAPPAQHDALKSMSTAQHVGMVPSLPMLTQELIWQHPWLQELSHPVLTTCCSFASLKTEITWWGCADPTCSFCPNPPNSQCSTCTALKFIKKSIRRAWLSNWVSAKILKKKQTFILFFIFFLGEQKSLW